MCRYNNSIRTLKVGIVARGSLIARGLEGLDMSSVLSVGHVDTDQLPLRCAQNHGALAGV